MAKVVITIDTEAKSISADVDGQVVDDIDSISSYKYETYDDVDKIDVSFSKREMNGSVKIMTHYCVAQKEGQAKASIEKKDPNEKARIDIANFFKAKRG